MGSFQSGVSGMLAQQVRMDVIGNNIANANTIGFKSSRVLFADQMYRLMRAGSPESAAYGGANPMQAGLGVYVAGTQTDFSQGGVVPTGRAMDVMIQGQGMLAVTDGNSIFYTRDGALGLDASGNLIHLASGMRVVSGATGEGGAQGVSPTATLRAPLGQSLARATSEAALGGNLDSRAEAGATHTITSRVYDSLGNGHDVQLTLTRGDEPGTWNVTATSPDGTVTVGSPATVEFDESGRPTAESLNVSLALTSPEGAAASIDVAFNIAGMTQQAQANSASLLSQNGVPPGTLTGVAFGADGSIQGVYSNGLRSPLGQLVTANFTNPHGLEAMGNNLYSVGANSGIPVYGTPGDGSHGALISGQLEGSNVNLAQEFSDMIITQRGYQANSRVITTSDEMLQEVMGLKR